ncbi:SDR family NAD(P)-dependent oxidoreductase [Bacteroidota bacterium]
MEQYLDNKNILVTGASRGIGRAIAEYLAKAGANLAIHYHQNIGAAKEVLDECGNKSFILQADLSNRNEVDKLFHKVVEEFATVDVIINNAGIAINSDPLGDDIQWTDDWLKTMEINLNATGYLCKKAISHFLEKTIRGKIINISSRAAFRGDTKDYLAYAASKGGVVSLTRSIARAFGKDGIVAFNVAPGFVKTDMAQQFFDEYGEDYALNDLALDRLTHPEDIAPFIRFLASGQADHATGDTFHINAGSYLH